MVCVANLSLVKPVFPAAQFTQRIPSDLFYLDKEGTLTSFIKENFLEIARVKDGKIEKPSV